MLMLCHECFLLFTRLQFKFNALVQKHYRSKHCWGRRTACGAALFLLLPIQFKISPDAFATLKCWTLKLERRLLPSCGAVCTTKSQFGRFCGHNRANFQVDIHFHFLKQPRELPGEEALPSPRRRQSDGQDGFIKAYSD